MLSETLLEGEVEVVAELEVKARLEEQYQSEFRLEVLHQSILLTQFMSTRSRLRTQFSFL